MIPTYANAGRLRIQCGHHPPIKVGKERAMRKAQSTEASNQAAESQRMVPEPSRRSFIRSAVLYAMFVGSGVSVSGCGGGGDGGGGGFGGGIGGGAPPGGTGGLFSHGVASGDPLSDRVILWTRITAPSPGTLNLNWEVASDPNFGGIVARGTATTGRSRTTP